MGARARRECAVPRRRQGSTLGQADGEGDRAVRGLGLGHEDVEDGEPLDADYPVLDIDVDRRRSKHKHVEEELRVGLGVACDAERAVEEPVEPLGAVSLDKVSPNRLRAWQRHLPGELGLHRVDGIPRDVEGDALIPDVARGHAEHAEVDAIRLRCADPHLPPVSDFVANSSDGSDDRAGRVVPLRVNEPPRFSCVVFDGHSWPSIQFYGL